MTFVLRLVTHHAFRIDRSRLRFWALTAINQAAARAHLGLILSLALGLTLVACNQLPFFKKQPFSIVSGSENKSLEPMIKALGRDNGLEVEVTYLGSVDIAREIQKGTACTYDAVWPASSIWLALGDTQRVVKHSKSIMRSPVVFAVKKPVAEKLGWIGKDITVGDILQVAEADELRFAMTSATQSNSGASAYLGYLHAFAQRPDVLTRAHLQEPQVRDQIKRFLGNVHRQTGSSGWLMDLLLNHYDQFDAVVNYEALIIEANQKLVAQGQVPLYVVYPLDGLTIADSPLAYIDRGDSVKEKAFVKLQTALLEPEQQRKILRSGRRVGRVGMHLDSANTQLFNPAWGLDTQRVLSPITWPGREVIQEALSLYQTAFRKPSLTIYVLDFSGSMEVNGEAQVKAAMHTLLEPEVASQYLLQPSPQDISAVIFFNGRPSAPISVTGNDPSALKGLLRQIKKRSPGGGTNMYAATHAALKLLEPYEARLSDYHTAIIVMSDGKSKGSIAELEAAALWRDIPVYTILFGNADPKQMETLATLASGRMFDGRTDMIHAFRQAKGYN